MITNFDKLKILRQAAETLDVVNDTSSPHLNLMQIYVSQMSFLIFLKMTDDMYAKKLIEDVQAQLLQYGFCIKFPGDTW